jgi:dipeptidyl aminopeptidase/acylaminoacyl peptidase
VHGGPYGTFGSAFMIDFEVLVGAGYAVLFNNFRGSGGYGPEFADKIVGEWGVQASLDHHATIDAAIAAGLADPDRVAVGGLSHGGYATLWLVGTSDRFKAGVAENASSNWINCWGVADTESWIPLEFGGNPWEVPERYRANSPLTHAPACSTPVLFVICEQDMRCHPTESEQYYRVLRSNGVAAEMLRMPDSTHGGCISGRPPVRRAQNEAMVEWADRYVK